MGKDDQLSAFLPEPPLPAPARRQAAIEEALRRFDGGPARPAHESSRPAAAAARWWRRPTPHWAPAFATAALALLIALPVAWTVIGDRSGGTGGGEEPAMVAKPSASAPAVAGAEPDAAFEPSDRSVARADRSAPAARREPALNENGDTALAELAAEPEPPPAAPPPAMAESRAARQERADDRLAAASSPITVTGSRVATPNVSTASRAEAAGEEDSIVLTGTRTGKAAHRGDWNACTVDDPRRSLAGCRHLVDPKARGAYGRSSSLIAEGLESAWQGDHEQAIASFDRAIAAAPGSAFAYLNRGLARKRAGDLDGALADLDRAIRRAPRTARLYYHRSLILRQRGDERRARADAERAVNLDPDYRGLID